MAKQERIDRFFDSAAVPDDHPRKKGPKTPDLNDVFHDLLAHVIAMAREDEESVFRTDYDFLAARFDHAARCIERFEDEDID